MSDPDGTGQSRGRESEPDLPFVDAGMLRAAQAVARAAAFSEIIRGIVHDARNPLQSIVFASHALDEQSDDSLVESISRGAERVSEAMEHLGHLLDPRVIPEGPLVLQEVVSKVIELQAHSPLRIRGEIRASLSGGLPPVRGTPQDVEDALAIVTTIGKEAIGKHSPGTITIAARLRDEQFVDVIISDTGGALPETLQASLADRPRDHLTSHDLLGAGLRASQAIMAAGGAEIRVQVTAQDGEGRSVISLPRWRA